MICMYDPCKKQNHRAVYIFVIYQSCTHGISSVVVWDIAKKEAICGHQAQVESAGITYCVAFSNRSDDVFVTGGE